MGDKSPKAAHKQASQKATKVNADKLKKSDAAEAIIAAAAARNAKK